MIKCHEKTCFLIENWNFAFLMKNKNSYIYIYGQLPNLDFLLCGSDDLSPEENINITNNVLQYIAETKDLNRITLCVPL